MSTSEEHIAWLVDRARISDLLITYARLADAKDFEGIGGLFTEDALFTASIGPAFRGRDFARHSGPVMAQFAATHHMITNTSIDIDRDRATAHSYVQAVHLTDAGDPSAHADIGGWYDHELVREEGVWRIASMNLTFVWTAGAPFGPGSS